MKYLIIIIFLFSNLQAETLTILCFSGQEDETDFATMTTLLENERKKAQYPITVLFGDLAPENEPALVEVFNEMKVDFAVFLSEKCYRKFPQVKDRLAQANFPLLAANIMDQDHLSPWLETKQTHFCYLNEIKIGVFGLSSPKCNINDEDICFLSFMDMARQKISELKKGGAEVIILFSDLTLNQNQKIVNSLKNIDVIIGHDAKGPLTWIDRNTLFHMQDKKGDFLGRIDLVLKKSQNWRGDSITIFPTYRMVKNDGLNPNTNIVKKLRPRSKQKNRF